LTAQAVRGLSDDQFRLEQLECLVCGTTIPDQLLPNHASMVHGELGLPPLEAVAVAGACLSGLSALNYAYMSVASNSRNNAVATGSELLSPVLSARNLRTETNLDPEAVEDAPELAFDRDFLRWMLSDGAGAALLESTPRAGRLSLRIDWIELFSYAGEMETCMYLGADKGADGRMTGWAQYSPQVREAKQLLTMRQDVKLLNEKIAHYSLEKPLLQLIPKHGLKADEIDYLLPHYSSKYFRDKLYELLKRIGFDVAPERWFTNLFYKGNTGAASMYLIIDELVRSGKLQRGHRLLCLVPESARFATGFMHLTVV
jgi:3-oxoacyl-[acyl-carrier-protein] synthase-3